MTGPNVRPEVFCARNLCLRPVPPEVVRKRSKNSSRDGTHTTSGRPTSGLSGPLKNAAAQLQAVKPLGWRRETFHLVSVKHAATALVIMALSTLVVDGRPKHPPRLPSSIRADLDRRFSTWAINDTAEELHKWFSTSKQGADPNLVSGDFNGDGLLDYAMQIITTSSGSAVRRVLVYLRRGKGYRHRTLTTGKPSTELILLLMRRGTKDYNYTRRREFRYKLGTIGLFSEKGGSSYFYRNGRFYPEITSD